ncbi:MAG: formylglycine-generating enzyme family protein [Phycisphaerales bacterium]|nr:formylglycine-generating enzyme family protein [Phycisphaerales bacterium]MCB9864818.1 formylglycine-generating enzyme family protein [Phycisphaerales bacterium]
MALNLFKKRARPGPDSKPAQARPAPVAEKHFDPAPPTEIPSDPLEACVALKRYGYLLAQREAWRGQHSAERACAEAADRIDDLFAIVPEGFASLPKTVNDYPGCPESSVETKTFLLARYPVTNDEFQRFVDAGGYDDMDLWPREIWPHLIDFRDQTDHSGPRFWRNGRHCRTMATHPVVGICFYEAQAYATWAGYRLPSEAEWQMAATWRIRSAANTMRRFPWGDALDTQRCNIWLSGVGKTMPVDAYPDGCAPNQVAQLVGNVWEWMADEYIVTDDNGNPVVSDMRMSSIRGGAFDTYFSSQATGTFRTGLVSMARVHNAGFRCALDVD